jgi:hypothetical protein
MGTAEKCDPSGGLVMIAGEDIGGALIEAVTKTSSALTPNVQATRKNPEHKSRKTINGYGSDSLDLFFLAGRFLAVLGLGIFILD